MPACLNNATAVRATNSRTQEQYSADYAALLATMKDLGLLRRRYVYYAVRSAILLGLLALGVVALFAFAPGPWLLLLAVGFSVLFTQFAFLAHDGAHRQIFTAGTRNEWFSRVVGNVFVGLSYGWWMNKHGKHHANPNKMGRDGDIDPGAIVFTPRTPRASRDVEPGGWRGSTGSSSRSSPGWPRPAHQRRQGRARQGEDQARRCRGRHARHPADRLPGRRHARRRTVVGTRVHGRADRGVRHLHGRQLRAEPQGDADRAEDDEHRLPAPPDPHVAQHQRRCRSRSRWAASTTRSSTTCSRPCRA